MKVEADIWEVHRGTITVLKHDGKHYLLECPDKPRGYKEPYLLKWIRKNNIKKFTLEDFFKAHPKRRKRKSEVIDLISTEIKANRMRQLRNEEIEVLV